MSWDKKEDTLAVDNVKVENDGVITRRTILSVTQWVFDPIGFTCPVSLCPKLLLQQCWALKGEWDREVPDDVRKCFLRWLQEVKIPRCLKGMSERVISCSLLMRGQFLHIKNAAPVYKCSWFKPKLVWLQLRW